jgi:hypothetical protein
MMNAEAKGTRNEHRSMKLLGPAGYCVTSSASSRGLGPSSAPGVPIWAGAP